MAATKTLVIPKVEVGQIVLWTYGPEDVSACPAIVLKVGNTSLTLALVTDPNRSLMIRSGVRYYEDPFLATMPQHDIGCWKLTPRDRRIDALLEACDRAASDEPDED